MQRDAPPPHDRLTHDNTAKWMSMSASTRQSGMKGPVSCPPGVAAGMGIGGVITAIAGVSGGLLSVGVAGLVVAGVALGLSGPVRARIGVATGIWLAVATLAWGGAETGTTGLVVVVPGIFTLMSLAVGQMAGTAAGIASIGRTRPRGASRRPLCHSTVRRTPVE